MRSAEHEELVATKARNEVGLSRRRAQADGDRLNEGIAGGMAVLVVDPFEAVEIEPDHG